jgi:hypothetical protein
MVAGRVSRLREPWFETTTASAPVPIACSASSGSRIPFRISGRGCQGTQPGNIPGRHGPRLRSANFEHADVPVLEVWRCEALGNFEACPELPAAIIWRWHVDRHADCVCAQCRHVRYEFTIETAVALPIEQEPDWRLAHRHANLRSPPSPWYPE